jgi:hypothetical protein
MAVFGLTNINVLLTVVLSLLNKQHSYYSAYHPDLLPLILLSE